MTPGPFAVTIVCDDQQELDDLYAAILRARASELTEVRRNQSQSVIYQDQPRGDTAVAGTDAAQRRYSALHQVAEAIRRFEESRDRG